MAKSSNGNVRMVITEEKILANIEKVRKMINPNSKKKIVQLEEDSYFLDLIASIKSYLEEYPKEDVFPKYVYNAAYDLVDYATTQFEENTKKIEELIRQREKNIALAARLREALDAVENKEEDWKDTVKKISKDFPEDIIDTLGLIGRTKSAKSQNYQDAVKLINARIANLESNLHIEIDMERIEDRSKALSYIGIEIADALKLIPTPQEDDEVEAVLNQIEETVPEEKTYFEQTRVEVKPTLWQRIKNSKIVKAISYAFKVKVVLQVPALPEGRGENN